MKKYPILLASKSPRRKQLMEESGFSFRVFAQDVEEISPAGMNPHDVAAYLSKIKAEASLPFIEGKEIVLAADTVVILRNQIFGKPANKEEAIEMLRRLGGNMHRVITGVTLQTEYHQIVFDVTTKVWIDELNDDEIHFYLDQYKPYDKAGSYGVQEWLGHCKIRKIEGSYTNVMGLPVAEVYRALKIYF